MSPQQVKRVAPIIIRQKFDNSQYPAMIEKGELVPKYLRDKRLQNPSERRHPEPEGTRSQYVRYSDAKGRWCVEVHQYLRPDGTLGATGQRDPKRLRIGNIIYIADPNL